MSEKPLERLTPRRIESWRIATKADYSHRDNRAEIDALCDLALQALAQPTDRTGRQEGEALTEAKKLAEAAGNILDLWAEDDEPTHASLGSLREDFVMLGIQLESFKRALRTAPPSPTRQKEDGQ